MDIKQIQELVKIINKTNISEIRIEENDFKITIKQKEDASAAQSMPQSYVPAQSLAMHAPAGAPLHLPVQAAAPAAAAPATAEPAKPTPAANDNHVTIKSPMIGTFYRSAAPGKPEFVSEGSDVAPGKVVCIIEAMKLFNEIESEVKGKIVKILVDDATPVEFDQPLFLVEPS